MTQALVGTKETIRIGRASSRHAKGTALEFRDSSSALDFLRPFLARPDTMSLLRAALAEDRLFTGISCLDDEQVLNELAWRLACGRFEATEEQVKRRPLPPNAEPGPAPAVATAPPPRKQKTWVEFLFEYPDHTPVSGLDYILEDPGGVQEAGTLGKDGLVARRDVPEGTYTVILKEILQAAWEPAKVMCDDKVKLIARTAGFPYGTAAKVRIFREFRETDADVVESIPTKVTNDQIEVEWKYDYTSSDQRKAETGVARFIAEVQIEQGKYWAKTQSPLQLQLKSIERVAWSAEQVRAKGSVDISVETRGYADGTEVKLELWSFVWSGENKKAADLKPAKLAGGKAKVSCTYGHQGGEAVIDQAGEYFVAAKIEGKVTRTAKSGFLWCVYDEAAEAPAAPA